MFSTQILPVFLFLCCAPKQVGASWSASGPELCVVPTTAQVRPDSTCSDTTTSSSNCASPAAYVNAQIGEVEDIQLLLRKSIDADDTLGGLTGVSVVVNGLPADISVKTFRVGYVWAQHSPRYAGSGGGWRPDPLMPISEKFDIPSEVAQPLWVSVSVGRNTVPGTYSGQVSITCTMSNTKACPALVVPVHITVFNVTLPTMAETRIGSAWSGSWGSNTFTPYYPSPSFDWNTTKHTWFDLMIDHRMPPDSIYLSKARDYDDYQYMASKGVKWFAILDVSSLPLTLGAHNADSNKSHDEGMPKRVHSGGVRGACANYSAEYVERLIDTLTPIVTKLEADGLLEVRVILYPRCFCMYSVPHTNVPVTLRNGLVISSDAKVMERKWLHCNGGKMCSTSIRFFHKQ
eukprot:m.243299 g.243299  ORF g.243299 m.243299 type:complete len:403 (+) comp19445_c0_seq4:87-1295(+)